MGATFIAEQAITDAIKEDNTKEVFVIFLCYYFILFGETLGSIIIHYL